MKNNAKYVKAGFLPCTHECVFKDKSGFCVLKSCSYEYTRRIMKKIPHNFEESQIELNEAVE